MTVKELKEKLEQFDDNLDVYMDNDTERKSCLFTPVLHISQGFNELDGLLILDDYVEDDDDE